MNWYAVEMHTHTVHSDGQMTVAELLENARRNRLALIALTDHNTQAGLAEAGNKVLPGIEWTTYHGHMTVLGAARYVDWRDIAFDSLDEKLWAIKGAGGLACVAHPYRMGSPICTGCHFDYPIRDAALVSLWEAWSGENAPLKEDSAKSFQAWTRLIDSGLKMAAVYGRDWHAPKANGPVAVTYIGTEGELTAKSALGALLTGRTAVTMGPLPVLTVQMDGEVFTPGDTLRPGQALAELKLNAEDRRDLWMRYNLSIQQIRLMGANGQLLARQPYRPEGNSFVLTLAPGVLRAEAWGEMHGKPCLLAFTSALYIRHNTMICAHAGAEGEAPNSLVSIAKAIETGCDALEVDVRSHLGKLVLSHDPLNPDDPEPVLLEQCFSLVKKAHGMLVNCDMKEPGLAADVVALAKAIGMGSRIVFTGSLNEQDMRSFPERPEAFWSVHEIEGTQSLQAACDLKCSVVNLDKDEVTPLFVQEAKARNLMVSAWTADKEQEIRSLLRMGVHSITTNRPRLAMALRDALNKDENI